PDTTHIYNLSLHDALPIFGEGNFTLAGHNMKNKDLLFGRLMDIEKGSTVYISNGINTYAYEIYDILVVSDTDTEMLSDEKSTEVDRKSTRLNSSHVSISYA